MDYLINSLVPTARTRDGRWSPCRQPSVEAAILRVRKHKRAGRRERVPVGAALSHTQTHTDPLLPQLWGGKGNDGLSNYYDARF